MSDFIKLSSPATQDFWEIPVIYEDEHLLALNKPKGLLTSPDRYDRDRPNLMRLLHNAIKDGKPWAATRQLTYLMNAHRLDLDTSGVILLAKNKPALVSLVNLFSAGRPGKTYVALVQGSPPDEPFTIKAPIAPHPSRLGEMRVDPKNGKAAMTDWAVRERFHRFALLTCRPQTGRTHQIRVHLRYIGLPIVGDSLYGGKPLLLSRLKKDYRLKFGAVERPLLGTVALHAEELVVPHPITGAEVRMKADWPHELTVAVKYLRRYARTAGSPGETRTDDLSEAVEPASPAE